MIDFGHARQIFKEADVFPSIIVLKRVNKTGEHGKTAHVCVIPREDLRITDLRNQASEEGFEVPLDRLGEAAWQLDPPAVQSLMERIRKESVTLREYAGLKPFYGIKTGFNKAFVVDRFTRDRLVAEDPESANVIRPYLRGQDIQRWSPTTGELWIILLKSSADHDWPWSSGGNPEDIFRKHFPAVYRHLSAHEERLRKRSDQGRNWWELRPCSYYEIFDQSRIVYQVIQYYPAFAFETEERFGNDKTFYLPVDDPYLLAVLNSPLMWWHNWRYLPHMKDDALNPAAFKMDSLPIAVPDDRLREEVVGLAGRLVDLQRDRLDRAAELLDWLRVEYDLEKPGQVLSSPFELASENDLIQAVRKRRGKKKLSASSLISLREEYTSTIMPMRRRLLQAVKWERRLSELVNEAYGLADDEVRLIWETAPPRMPITGP